ncbi:MAG: hypothetical protein D8M58_20120 [Calditrichaeota bacterium]|nr:MAG: hypothetical protein DWQ03_14105 [Calditrichota bacterium]MBL1207717.1 hypothetical protein [Calditrichota bacterium]NOG47552.1 hypothetical protein [Calditrichota bacterium]
MDLYKNTYRTDTTRLKYWDYSNPGLYFITICTFKHLNFFGQVINAKMHLNDQGTIALNNWLKIKDQFDSVILDEFVIMPNHIHGIILITKSEKESNERLDVINQNDNNKSVHGRDAINQFNDNKSVHGRDAINRVSTKQGGITGEKNPMISKHSISKIIRWYKGRCTFEIKKTINRSFQWQSRFYDHIIRNEKSYLKIKDYIRYNPNKWEDDRYYES